MNVCDQPVGSDHATPAYVAADREEWCAEHGKLAEAACSARFADLDARFAVAWTEERESARADLPALDLRGRDLPRAEAAGVSLIRADLRGARMEGANLTLARMEGANLTMAQMEGAVLWGARMEGANLREADFRKSKWAGASNRASPAHLADFRGAQDLTQGQLDELIGNAGTLLPDGKAPDSGQPYYIWSCWETPPDGFDDLIRRIAEASFEGPNDLRAEFLCGGSPRLKLETGLALDAPYPPNHPLADAR